MTSVPNDARRAAARRYFEHRLSCARCLAGGPGRCDEARRLRWRGPMTDAAILAACELARESARGGDR